MHKAFGEGIVLDVAEGFIKVRFDAGEKEFRYPDAFDRYLTANDQGIQAAMDKEIASYKDAEEKRQAQESMRNASMLAALARPRLPVKSPGRGTRDLRTNIAFKCNYCDGGRGANGIGFSGICSKGNLQFNIEVRKYGWCTDAGCSCKAYHDGELSYSDLIGRYHYDEWPCHDSITLRDWTAYTQMMGSSTEQEAMRSAKYAQSLAILTTRTPEDEEEDRFIFAVFLIGGYSAEGYERGGVFTAVDGYHLQMAMHEAKRLKFWNYYHNRNGAKDKHWGSGLQRNLTDVEAARILKDIVDLKRGTGDEAIAEEFLTYYCKLHPSAGTC